MSENITRRRAIGAGTLAALAAVVAPTVPVLAAPELPPIERAEALLVELAAILPRLSERDVCNVGHNLDIMYRASEGGAERLAEWLADGPLAIGEGRRICDEMDRLDALEEEATSLVMAAAEQADVVLLADDDHGLRPVFIGVDRIKADFVARYGDDGEDAFRSASISMAYALERSGKARRAGAEGLEYVAKLDAMPEAQQERVRRMFQESGRATIDALKELPVDSDGPFLTSAWNETRDRHIAEDPEAAGVAYGLWLGLLEERFPESACAARSDRRAGRLAS